MQLSNRNLESELMEARRRYVERHPGSREAHERATKSMPGGNTRTVLFHGPFPLRIVSGHGPWLVDVDQNRYLNLLGEFTAGLFGHSHPFIRKAIDRALDGGVNLSAHNCFELELAELVVSRFPAIEKVRFTNSGTEANLMAVSTARQFTGRNKVMVFRGGYHGGLLYFGGGGHPINAPYDFVVSTYNDLETAARLIGENKSDLACVLVEPMMGASGCIPADPEFLDGLRELTQQAGVLLIFDEVMTSRFGRGGAQSILGITPDLVTLGKWIAGGMSFGAFGGRSDIMALYDPTVNGSLSHAGTFNNNVLSMCGGIAALTTVFPSDVAEAHHARGEALRERLNTMFVDSHVRLQVTGKGSLMNIHATTKNIRNPDDLSDSNEYIKEIIFLRLIDNGYYIARRGFVALSIALDEDMLDGFFLTMKDIVRDLDSIISLRGN